MTEIRRPVVGYEGQYQVSDLGNVKSLNKGILMSPSTTPNGYSVINLSNNGRRKCFAIQMIHWKLIIKMRIKTGMFGDMQTDKI